MFQGQTQGYSGFLMPNREAISLIKKNKSNKNHLLPFLTGDDMLGNKDSQPSRHSIDFSFAEDVLAVRAVDDLYEILHNKVYPEVEQNAILEREGKIKPNGRENHLKTWWHMWRRRTEMLNRLEGISRYISCSRVSTRPTFEFISSKIRPNDALIVFGFDDYYSFGIINSLLHIRWYQEKCSTMKGDPRYTKSTIWDTFPWPQNPTENNIKEVAKVAQELYIKRIQVLKEYNLTLRELYRTIEEPGKNPISKLHQKLDETVMKVYGFDPKVDILTQLLKLNQQVAERENNKEPVQAPGLPEFYTKPKELITDDCVKFNL